MLELNQQEITTPPRPAATVVVLRDAPAGLEVFLVRRHGASDVLGGAHVFPGGKVDAADASAEALGRLDAPAEVLRQALQEPDLPAAAAAAFFFAACRETFEESGVLLGRHPDGVPADAAMAARAAALAREGLPFAGILERLDLVLDCTGLACWSRWITPRVPAMMSKRFDTRFFLVTLPQGQQALHDDHEADDSTWLAPREALARYWNREISLAPPQIMSLAHLARFGRAADALAEARGRCPPLIEPASFEHEGTRAIAYPGDPHHLVSERAWPGPSRVVFRQGRFEPLSGGFDAFFLD